MNQTTIIATLALLLFGIGYAAIVRHTRRRTRAHGQTAWFVVVGVAAVILAFSVIAGEEMGRLLLILFTAAGLPMVIEYVDDHTDTLRRLRMAANLPQSDGEN